MGSKIKTKIFIGTINDRADKKFNDWIEEENVDIIKFKYQHTQHWDHSICILYKDYKDED